MSGQLMSKTTGQLATQFVTRSEELSQSGHTVSAKRRIWSKEDESEILQLDSTVSIMSLIVISASFVQFYCFIIAEKFYLADRSFQHRTILEGLV
jgi:hypothetical protein